MNDEINLNQRDPIDTKALRRSILEETLRTEIFNSIVTSAGEILVTEIPSFVEESMQFLETYGVALLKKANCVAIVIDVSHPDFESQNKGFLVRNYKVNELMFTISTGLNNLLILDLEKKEDLAIDNFFDKSFEVLAANILSAREKISFDEALNFLKNNSQAS